VSSKVTQLHTSESSDNVRTKGTDIIDSESATGGIYSVACGCRSLCFDWLQKVGACPRGMPWDCPGAEGDKRDD
jgi:hypothetical protein